MREDNIFFLVATGLHRAPTDAELREILGEELLRAHRVVSHDARDESSMSRIGHTSRGTPIDINRAYLESDLRIVIGLVEPHFMAGYSGGRKSVAIGLCSVESVKRLHGTGFLEHPGARNCELEGNPLHAELTEIATAAGVDFCVSAVLDAERRIGGIFCGDVVESHAAASEFAEKYCVARSGDAYDIVVTTAAGYPLDTTYYQAVKGLVGALDILAPGGALILASECSAGLGSAEFRLGLERLREFGDFDDFLRHIAEPANFVVDQWEVEMLVKALRAGDIYMYSTGIPDSDWPLTFARRVGSVREGLDLASAGGRDAGRVAVIPEGPYIIPRSDDGATDDH
jgi:nickel-dependent lactate racemase